MLKFSLIVPIYNVEKFLPQCLDSILDQDIPLEEYEIICIIDGSPDNCTNIVKEYQEKYSNIVLFEQKNSGVSTARNNGIELSKGEYLWFIDPDDFIVSNCLKYLYDEIKKDDYDMIKFNWTRIEETMEYNKLNYTLQTAFDNKAKVSDVCTISIIKKQVYSDNDLNFNPLLLRKEDVLYYFYLTALDLKIKTLHNVVIYIYRRRKNSSMTSRNIEDQKIKANAILICASEIESNRTLYINNKKMLNYINYKVQSLCVGLLIDTFIHNRKDYKTVIQKMTSLKLLPFRYKKKLNIKQCKKIKQYMFAVLEFLMYKNWFVRFLKVFG